MVGSSLQGIGYPQRRAQERNVFKLRCDHGGQWTRKNHPEARPWAQGMDGQGSSSPKPEARSNYRKYPTAKARPLVITAQQDSTIAKDQWLLCILILLFSKKKFLLCISYLIHHCLLRMLWVQGWVRQGMGKRMSCNLSTRRCIQIWRRRLSIVHFSWVQSLDGTLTPSFRGGVNVFCVKEEKDLHGYLGDQKGGLWETATCCQLSFQLGVDI